MFGIGGDKTKEVSYGVVIDIGSGSVGIAIVKSNSKNKYGDIIWSLREWAPVHKTIDRTRLQNNLKTATFNCFLALENEGLKILQKTSPGAKIKTILASISALAAFTIYKSITIEKDKPFLVTKKLIKKMEEDAMTESVKMPEASQVETEMALKAIANSTTLIKLNGYTVEDYENKKVQKVELTHTSCLAHRELVEVIVEAKEKVLPAAKLHMQSFVTSYFQAIRSLTPVSRATFLDVTAEATELSIVDEKEMIYTSHAPVGANFIARGVNAIIGTSFNESLGFMRDNQVNLTNRISPEKGAMLEGVKVNYENKLTELLTGQDGKLDIPPTIYLHCDRNYEKFFQTRIEKILSTNASKPTVFPVTSKFFPESSIEDSGILLTAHVFHKKTYCEEEIVS